MLGHCDATQRCLEQRIAPYLDQIQLLWQLTCVHCLNNDVVLRLQPPVLLSTQALCYNIVGFDEGSPTGAEAEEVFSQLAFQRLRDVSSQHVRD